MAVSGYALPPPSGRYDEILFRRLLDRCEGIVTSESTLSGKPLDKDVSSGSGDGERAGEGWRTDPKFRHYVETLEEQLVDLKDSDKDGEILPTTMQMYRERVQSLSRGLLEPSLPLFAKAIAAQTQSSPESAQPALAAVAAAAAAAGAAETRPVKEQTGLRQRGGTGSDGLSASSTDRERVETQRALHEDLTDDLVQLVASLKEGTKTLHGRLASRGGLMDDTHDALAKSAAEASANTKQLGKVQGKTKQSTWTTMLALLAMGVVFAVMVQFIFFTSIGAPVRSSQDDEWKRAHVMST